MARSAGVVAGLPLLVLVYRELDVRLLPPSLLVEQPRLAGETPDDVALITKDRRLSFREFKESSDALAAGLLGAGVGRDDLVSVQLPNWLEFCFLQIALSRIGAVIQPSHLVYREREIRSLLSFCET